MRPFVKVLGIAGALAVAAPIIFMAADGGGEAADHLDAPTRTDPAFDPNPDVPADIADVYAWHTPQFFNVALTFAGPAPANSAGTYDRDVLYTINISNQGSDTDAEFPIRIRFGRDGQAVGVKIENVPGTTGPIIGPVETNLEREGVTARAGLFDDPFYFDLQGFRETRSTGTLAFRSDRDFFRGQNDTGVVIQIPRAAVDRNAPIQVWATADRFGGNL